MMSLNTLRTQFGVLLSIVIGGALLAFIFSLKNDVGFSGNDPEVGQVDGKDVDIPSFLKGRKVTFKDDYTFVLAGYRNEEGKYTHQ